MVIITDSSSGIDIEEAKGLDIEIVPLVITMNGENFIQETPSQIDYFYSKLETTNNLPVTSRPSPENYLKFYDKAESIGEDVLVLTLSHGLSGTYESAMVARNMSSWKEHIYVIDTKQAILSLRLVVEYAVELNKISNNPEEIIEKVQSVCERATVYGVAGTLKFLKMGGRIPKSLATIGEVLQIKPIIELKNGKLVEVGKSRGFGSANKTIIDKFLLDEFDPKFPVYFGYTQNIQLAETLRENTLIQRSISNTGIYQIGPSIGSHLGCKGIAIAYVKK